MFFMQKLGYRCEWCGMTTHSGCRSYISNDCTFGVLQPIYLPPHAVSIPRTEVPMEAIIGVQVRSRSTPLQRDYSCRKYSIIHHLSSISLFFSLSQDALKYAHRKKNALMKWRWILVINRLCPIKFDPESLTLIKIYGLYPLE